MTVIQKLMTLYNSTLVYFPTQSHYTLFQSIPSPKPTLPSSTTYPSLDPSLDQPILHAEIDKSSATLLLSYPDKLFYSCMPSMYFDSNRMIKLRQQIIVENINRPNLTIYNYLYLWKLRDKSPYCRHTKIACQ